MVEKLIYIFERRHVYLYDYDKEGIFGIDYFKSKGLQVEVWSCVDWTFRKKLEEPLSMDRTARYFNNELELKREMDRIKDEKCIFLVYSYHVYTSVSFIIRKNIKKYGFEYCNLFQELWKDKQVYNVELRNNFGKLLMWEMKICIATIRAIIRKGIGKNRNKKERVRDLVRYEYKKHIGPILYPSKYNFVPTEKAFLYYPNKIEMYSKKNKVVGSEDYRKFLEGNHSEFINNTYVVYIDQYLDKHSDFEKHGLKRPVSDSNKYHSQLNYLFDNIEKLYECNVIIAAHPKAEYKGDEFGNRKIYQHMTDALIRDAKLVLIQYSTSMNMIVMHKKTFLNIYTEEIYSAMDSIRNAYDVQCKRLRCKKLDIANKKEVEQFQDYISEYDENSYNAYKREYIISEELEEIQKTKFENIYDFIMQ